MTGTCSECTRPLPPYPKAGRPRDTCSKECAKARTLRRKREDSEFRRADRKARASDVKHLAEAFGPGGDLEPGVFKRSAPIGSTEVPP
jgi:hypothetical protein